MEPVTSRHFPGLARGETRLLSKPRVLESEGDRGTVAMHPHTPAGVAILGKDLGLILCFAYKERTRNFNALLTIIGLVPG